MDSAISTSYSPPKERHVSDKRSQSKRNSDSKLTTAVETKLLKLTELKTNSPPDRVLAEFLKFSHPDDEVTILAHVLLKKFGTIGRVLFASPSQLNKIAGAREIAPLLASVRELLSSVLRDPVDERPVLSGWPHLRAYLRFTMASGSRECCRFLLLSAENRLLRDHIAGYGTVNHVSVYSRELLSCVYETGATAVIIVHNHPSGNPRPSDADQHMAEELRTACTALGIVLHDFLIVADRGIFSMKADRVI